MGDRRPRGGGRGANLEELEDAYRRRYPDFLRVAGAICQDVESGREAVHDAFVGLIRGRHRFRRTGPLDSWIWAAVVNSSRSRARNVTYPVEDASLDDPWTSLVRELQLERESVRKAVAGLPEQQRLTVFLRYYADLDYASIGRVLDVTPGTVAAALYAAHKTLRRTLLEVESNA